MSYAAWLRWWKSHLRLSVLVKVAEHRTAQDIPGSDQNTGASLLVPQIVDILADLLLPCTQGR